MSNIRFFGCIFLVYSYLLTKPFISDMSDNINIIIADDHDILATGIASLLSSQVGLEVVGVVHDGLAVLEAVELKRPHIVIMDINMPKLSGLEAAKQIKEKYNKTKVLILSMHDKSGYVQQAIAYGVDGYLLKNSGLEEIVTAIDKIMAGKTHFSSEVAEVIVRNLREEREGERMVRLSETEIKMLNFLADGATIDEVGDALGVSKHTINSYKKNLFFKLEAKNISHLIKIAIVKGYITTED